MRHLTTRCTGASEKFTACAPFAVRHTMGDAARETDFDFHSELAAGQCERKWQ